MRGLASRLSLLLLAAAAGCSFDADANPARGCDESCPPGNCVLGYCLSTSQVGNPVNTAGSGGSSPSQSGAGGGTSTAGSGAGASGGGAGSTGVPPGCTPASETCNGLDDDCDGQSDEALMLGSCEATGTGACTTGVLRCENGMEACIVAAEPTDETCDGLDDDCDGEADEDTTEGCYPDGMPGCTARDDGTYDCVGRCAAGVRVCEAGVLGECTGFVQPQAEACGGDEAADENCNGEVDDGCPCMGDETQSCYTGPARTAGVGICRRGTQTCDNGVFGACEGSVVPAEERCTNEGADDDCDGVADDVFGEGIFCVAFANQGVCRYGVRACRGGSLVCVTPSPAAEDTRCDGQDEDCDGRVDETFAFATDESNCGACGMRCASGQQCCASACRNLATDPQHCGTCGNACAAGQTCCGGQCVPTDTPDHCGGCAPCAAGQTCCGGQCVPANTTTHCGGCQPCATGQACCDGRCVDTNTVNHCGGCQRCAAGLACCDGQCVSLDTNDHCGSCAPCATGQACCDRACVPTGTDDRCAGCQGCETGTRCCQGACVVPNSAEDLCSSCDAAVCAEAGCTCMGNQCVDAQGLPCL